MRTEVIFIIDESGSMESRAEDVRGGFNTYIDKLKEDRDNDYRVSLTTFADFHRPVFTQRPLAEVSRLTKANYRPAGSTALYDAIGRTCEVIKDDTDPANYCNSCGRKNQDFKFCPQCGLKFAAEPGKVKYLVIIMTDGMENASTAFRKHDIQGKISRREARGNWTFVYLGANQNAWAVGAGLGIRSNNNYGWNLGETQTYFGNMAMRTTTYAGSPMASTANFASASAGGAVPDWDSSLAPLAEIPQSPATPTNPPRPRKRPGRKV